MIDSMIQGFSQFVNVIWMLFFLGPLYVIMSKFLAVVLQGTYVYLGKRNTFLYKYCGDLTWLLPFKVFFVISKFIKYNQSLKSLDLKANTYFLLAILLALLSIFLVLSIVAHNTSELVRLEKEKRELLLLDTKKKK